MSSAVAELESALQGMQALKPPGVSGSRITNITNLCTSNVQSESVLVQKLYTHFKKTPGTHKLGVLYVVDSVTRKWIEQAKLAGQTVNHEATDGTYAAGVNRVKELLPVLMSDIISHAPAEHKEKIKKLLDIWDKGQTFPAAMIAQFKTQIETASQNASTTPPGSPPPHLQQALAAQSVVNVIPPKASESVSAPNTLSVLETLANMARQNTAASMSAPVPKSLPTSFPPAPVSTPVSAFNFNPSVPAQGNSYPVSIPPSMTSQVAASHPGMPFPSMPSPVTHSGPQGLAGSSSLSAMTLDPAIQNQLLWIKLLSDQGVAPDKIAAVIASLGANPLAGAANQPVPPNGLAMQSNANSRPPYDPNPAWMPGAQNESRDYRARSRSSSPRRARNSRDSPNSRPRDGYGRGSPDHDRGRSEYRVRSPPRQRSRSTSRQRTGHQTWIGHDANLPSGHIKVLSRTLFVGGVTMSEFELKNIFSRYGTVQTCIVNKEKRHAFVKMVTRDDALHAKEKMEKGRTPDSQLRTRWGVGFGPRECSDYQTGVSIIPIAKLTDADRKWMLTAEYGGSGGKTIESGMVVEEPDIEIGAGVSSKAISRRMQTDKGGSNGPRSGRDYDDRRESRVDERSDHGRDAAVPGTPNPILSGFQFPGAFPFGMPGMQNGMPVYPPGFMFPQASSMPQQPPPPGRS